MTSDLLGGAFSPCSQDLGKNNSTPVLHNMVSYHCHLDAKVTNKAPTHLASPAAGIKRLRLLSTIQILKECDKKFQGSVTTKKPGVSKQPDKGITENLRNIKYVRR